MYSVFDLRRGLHHWLRVTADETIEIEIGEGDSVLDILVRRGGEPVAGAQLGIGRFDQTLMDARFGTTDRDGRFHFDGVVPGFYLVFVRDARTGSALLRFG